MTRTTTSAPLSTPPFNDQIRNLHLTLDRIHRVRRCSREETAHTAGEELVHNQRRRRIKHLFSIGIVIVRLSLRHDVFVVLDKCLSNQRDILSIKRRRLRGKRDDSERSQSSATMILFSEYIARVSSRKVSNAGVFLSEVVHTMRKNTRKDSVSAPYLEISNI
jgi:hypothetical protein